jgi:hypothetical protein
MCLLQQPAPARLPFFRTEATVPPPYTGGAASLPRSGCPAGSAPSAFSSATVTGTRARCPPSSILNAAARPSVSANASTASAPALISSPGTASISVRSSRLVPEFQSGWARMASATRRSGVPGPARTMAWNARARPVSDNPNSAAPQPSTPTAPAVSPASPSMTRRISRCSGWPGPV